ncbi:MAG TPA: DMT family transporter, partial [Woeseiaceae bacterium]|nr:DMT family transporter [Woeseiaceae bacterium]
TSAFVILGEQPSVVELVAGAVVITGVLLGSLPGRKKVQTPTVDAEALRGPRARAAAVSDDHCLDERKTRGAAYEHEATEA